jgi:GT2 family glycosyltransferase
MTNTPLFSVIVPAYNRSQLLREALASVMAQTFHDFELIVVDDGSTDDTSETVRRFGGPVRFLQQANLGPGAARNFGADHAAGRYLAFLDSDDLWFPWTLDAYARVIAQHHSPAFIAGKPRVFNSTSELKSVHQEPLSVAVFGDYFRSGDQWRWWGATSFVIRADAFGAAGGFTNEPINGEDADLALRLGDTPGFRADHRADHVRLPSTRQHGDAPVAPDLRRRSPRRCRRARSAVSRRRCALA